MARIAPSNKPNSCQQDLINRKYGMFIHFGINTFNDTEWSDGTLPIESYNPETIDVESWIKNAYEAGMNYVIMITKHHDGFCMWDTDTTDYCVNKSPNKTDIIMEARKACDKYGIKLGLYYSLWDRHEKCYENDEEYTEYMITHLKELLGGKYGEICELWLDGGWEKSNDAWNIPKLYDTVKEMQPECAITVNLTIGDYNSVGSPKKANSPIPKKYKKNQPMRYFPSDFRLFDPYFTRKNDPKQYDHNGESYYLPFEATICIRNMKNWFWDPVYTKEKLCSKRFIIKKYNLLINAQNALVINLAPNIHGVQEKSDVDRLQEVARELNISRI